MAKLFDDPGVVFRQTHPGQPAIHGVGHHGVASPVELARRHDVSHQGVAVAHGKSITKRAEAFNLETRLKIHLETMQAESDVVPAKNLNLHIERLQLLTISSPAHGS